MKDPYTIRRLESADSQAALRLVWNVFLEFEAPEYSDEGIQEFRNFIELSAVMHMQSESKLFLWGCYCGSRIVGVIATRSPSHISLLFVDKQYHQKGIARTLYHTVLDHYKMSGEHTAMTVNSSPYAAEIYRRLGFVDTDTEQVVNGIRFVPMKHIF